MYNCLFMEMLQGRGHRQCEEDSRNARVEGCGRVKHTETNERSEQL